MAVAKKKAEGRQLKGAVLEERRANMDSKRRRDLTLMEKISCQDPTWLSKVAVKDFNSLLMYHRPYGTADSNVSNDEL